MDDEKVPEQQPDNNNNNLADKNLVQDLIMCTLCQTDKAQY